VNEETTKTIFFWLTVLIIFGGLLFMSIDSSLSIDKEYKERLDKIAKQEELFKSYLFIKKTKEDIANHQRPINPK
jgi:hypothetical protein